MLNFGQDLRYALRQMVKNPGFTLITALTLALGIGANTAIFSVVNGVLIRPLPYENGDRIVHIGYRKPAPGVRSLRFSVPELNDYTKQSQYLEQIVEYHSLPFTLLGEGEPDRVKVAVVSGNIFQAFGVKPLLGRTLRVEDAQPGAERVLVLTYDYWMRRFGGDPKIVGKVLRMNDNPIKVIGVLPKLPSFPGKDDVYLPTVCCPVRSSPMMAESRGMRMLDLFGLLKKGTTAQQAQADLSTIAGRLRAEYPSAKPPAESDQVMPLVSLQEELTSDFRPTLLILLGTVCLVLLIACANVANLTLARLMNREREVVMRAALGASRGRLIRQMLTESTLLSLLGGILGLLIAFVGKGLLVSFAQQFTLRTTSIAIDGWVLLFTLLISLLTGLAFGLVPAFQTSRHNLAAALKEVGTRSTVGLGKHRFRSFLIVTQVAVSFVLLATAGLTLRSLIKLQDVDPGFNPANVLTMKVSLPFSKYSSNSELASFSSLLLERLKEHPKIVSAGMSTDIPLESNAIVPTFQVEGVPPPAPGQPEPQASINMASQDYFRTLGIPLIKGRPFADTDNAGAPQVVVINQSLAQQQWPGQDPIGKRVSLSGGVGTGFRTIVGIVGDVKDKGLGVRAGSAFYLPMLQAPVYQIQLFVRTSADATSVVQDINGIVHSIDPEQPIAEVRTLAQVRSDSLAPSRLVTVLIGLFATLAFAITVMGISGVIASFVTERTQEIGIRSALGAQKADVISMILRQGMGTVAVGLVVGILASLALTKLLSSLLFGVQPSDPLTFGAVSLVLLAVVGVSCFIPARRATSIDPIIALRS